MTHEDDYQVGDSVRLTCDLPAAGAGTEGVITAVKRDDRQQITALTILVAASSQQTYGTGVFPREVELVRRADGSAGEGR